MKTKMVVLILLGATLAAAAVFAETVTLSTILPSKLRAQKGAIGANVNNPTSGYYISDANMPTNGLSIEGGLYVGRKTYDFQSCLYTVPPADSSAWGTAYLALIDRDSYSSRSVDTIWISPHPPLVDQYSLTGWNGLRAGYGRVILGSQLTSVYGNITWGYLKDYGGMAGQLTVGAPTKLTSAPYALYIGPNYASATEIQLKAGINNDTGAIYLNCADLYGPQVSNCHWNSDASLKKDVVTIPDALERVCNLRGVNYRLKEGQDQSLGMGVIAQEVEPVFPELVNTDAQGRKSVAYMAMVGALVEAIKAQQKEIEALKAEVAAVKAKK